MIDREILWKRVKVVEIKDVNAYAHKKDHTDEEAINGVDKDAEGGAQP